MNKTYQEKHLYTDYDTRKKTIVSGLYTLISETFHLNISFQAQD